MLTKHSITSFEKYLQVLLVTKIYIVHCSTRTFKRLFDLNIYSGTTLNHCWILKVTCVFFIYLLFLFRWGFFFVASIIDIHTIQNTRFLRLCFRFEFGNQKMILEQKCFKWNLLRYSYIKRKPVCPIQYNLLNFLLRNNSNKSKTIDLTCRLINRFRLNVWAWKMPN